MFFLKIQMTTYQMKNPNRILHFLFIGLLLLSSCSRKADSKITSYIQHITNANSLSITEDKSETIIQAKYDLPINMQADYLASIMAIAYSDTSKSNLESKNIEEIKVVLTVVNQTDTFLYPVKLLAEYKKGISATATFIDNMLRGRSNENLSLVDTSQIPESRLAEINDIGTQIKTTMNIEHISFDGFSISPEDIRIIQMTVQFTNKQEQMLLTFQYNIANHKIFYFGLNDDGN
jgi:hypothetical protein